MNHQYFLWCLILLYTNVNLAIQNELSNDNDRPNVQRFLSHFNNCQVTTFTTQLSTSPHTWNADIIMATFIRSSASSLICSDCWADENLLEANILKSEFTKFVSCKVHMYTLTNISEMPLKSVSGFTNPNFVVYHAEKQGILPHFWHNNHYLNARQYMIIEFKEVLHLCAHCQYNASKCKGFRNQQPTNFNGEAIISDAWKIIKQKDVKVSCGQLLYRSSQLTPANSDICASITIGKKLNFSLIFGQKLYHKGSKYEITSHEPLNKHMIKKFHRNEQKLVEFTVIKEPFGFVVFKDKMLEEQKYILKVLDFRMWTTLMSLLICLRISAAASLLAIKKKPMKLINIWVAFATPNVQKRLNAFSNQWNHINVHKLNKVIWALSMSTVVGYAFKGNLISHLSSGPVINYSKQLNDLVSSGMPLLTFSFAIPPFGVTIIELAIAEIRLFAIKNNLTMPRYILDLKRSVFTPQNGLRDFVVDMFALKNGITPISRIKHLERGFSVIDSARNLNTIKAQFASLIPSMWCSPFVHDHHFYTIVPFLVNRGSFYTVFKDNLAQLYECGIYGFWNYYYHEMKQSSHLEEPINKINRRFNKTKSHFLLLEKARAGPRTQSLAVDKLETIWYMFLIALLGVSLIFIVEKFADLIAVNRNKILKMKK